jgi:hypothetical protein
VTSAAPLASVVADAALSAPLVVLNLTTAFSMAALLPSRTEAVTVTASESSDGTDEPDTPIASEAAFWLSGVVLSLAPEEQPMTRSSISAEVKSDFVILERSFIKASEYGS